MCIIEVNKIRKGIYIFMKLDRYRKYVRAGVTAFLVLAASMIFYYLLFHQTSVRTAFHNVLNILSPLIAALILAYVISPIINFIEQRIIARLFARHRKTQSVRCKKLVRALLILLTYVAMLFALYGLIATLIPELFSSIANIVSNFSNYANNIQDFATKVLANYPEMQQTADQYISTFSAKLSNWLTNDLMPMLRTFLLNLSGQLVNMVTFFKNILLGAIVAIYMLYNKESYIAKLKKAVYALLGLDHGNAVIRDCEPGIQRVPRWKSHRFDHHRCHLLSCDEPDRHPVRTAGQRNHRCDEYHSVFRPVPRRRSVSSADPSDRPSAGTVFPDFRRSPAAV